MNLDTATNLFKPRMKVIYQPISSIPHVEITEVVSDPWVVGDGSILIKVKGHIGGVSVDHLYIIDMDFTSVNHVRINAKASGPRITDHGASGETLCGAPMTDRDISMVDARRAIRCGYPLLECSECLQQVAEEDPS